MGTTSLVTGRIYNPERCVNLLNPLQVSRYIKHGATLYDILIGRDDKLVYVFDKDETRELFTKWVNHELD